MKNKIKKISNKINFQKRFEENNEIRKNLKLLSLFLFGFLIGIILKSQASRIFVTGYDDYRIMHSDNVDSGNLILPNENGDV